MGWVKAVSAEARAKASPIRALISCARPETRRAYRGQVEGTVKRTGGPNHRMQQNPWMTCGKS